MSIVCQGNRIGKWWTSDETGFGLSCRTRGSEEKEGSRGGVMYSSGVWVKGSDLRTGARDGGRGWGLVNGLDR